MGVIEARRRIILNEPHIVAPTSAELVNFNTDMVAPLKECKVHFAPVQSGTGDPSPDNVRPISGWTGINVTRCGKNLFDKTTVQAGYIDDADGQQKGQTALLAYKCTDYIPVFGGMSVYINTEQTAAVWGAWYDINKSFVLGVTNYAYRVITAPENAKYLRLTIGKSDNGNIDTFAVNYPSTDHAYHTYTGTTIPIDWTDEAGTVYGGYVDLVRGEVVAEWAKYVFTGNETWTNWGASGAKITPLQIESADTNRTNTSLCDKCRTWKSGDLYSGAVTDAIATSGQYITCASGIYANISSLTGATLVYPLATPITYALTPQIVKSLRGVNNVWSNTNDIIDLSYWTH